MRLIDADALRIIFTEKSSERVCGVELCKAIISRIDEMPTVDAGTVGEEPMECPGFESNECFVLKESLRKYYETFDEVTRCKDCRYFGERMRNGYWSCGRREGCVMTIPEGFCGWAVRRKENG